MGYQIYRVGKRWAGYGVPAICEHPKCKEKIDRGMAYACGGMPFSERGCDRYFCGKHLYLADDPEYEQLCERCMKGDSPFPYKPETEEWVNHLLTDESWEEWREQNPLEVKSLNRVATNAKR